MTFSTIGLSNLMRDGAVFVRANILMLYTDGVNRCEGPYRSI